MWVGDPESEGNGQCFDGWGTRAGFAEFGWSIRLLTRAGTAVPLSLTLQSIATYNAHPICVSR
jgi:hypothetical protein